ncbi:MAG: hypothetical protein QGF00_33310, partial [Planctomycetota bacterium]|nr:hypothetical protein [Planctomycetota bacterium]
SSALVIPETIEGKPVTRIGDYAFRSCTSLAGGLPGGSSISILKHHDSEEVLPVMVSTEIKKGEILYHRQPGGGGYGDPRDRDDKAVATDVQNERISSEAAEQVYGVSLNEGETDSG